MQCTSGHSYERSCSSQPMAFEFVVTNQSNPHMTAAGRRIVLKQSRKAGAQSRARQITKKVNELQIPDFLLVDGRRIHHSQVVHLGQWPPIRPAISDLKCMIDFSILTQHDLAVKLLQRAAQSEVNEDPRRWIKISRLLASRLFQLLPINSQVRFFVTTLSIIV